MTRPDSAETVAQDYTGSLSFFLTQGQAVLIDIEDYDLLCQYRWKYDRKGYAIACVSRVNGKAKHVLMHRVILGATRGTAVDHINLNGLDNRRANLRFCTAGQNGMNSLGRKQRVSRFKGVVFHKSTRRWQSQIKLNRTCIFLGRFATEEEAASAYDAAATQYCGEFARLNFPSQRAVHAEEGAE